MERTIKSKAHQNIQPSWPSPTWSLNQNNSYVQTDPIGELHSVLPSTGDQLKKQLGSQTKLGAGHLSHQPLPLPFLTWIVLRGWANTKKLKCNKCHSFFLSFSYCWRKPWPNHPNFSKLVSLVLKISKTNSWTKLMNS